MADISKIKLPDNTEYEIKDAKARMVILRYGISTWQDFLTAYQNNCVVYCRASSNSNPATGSQTRMAFMAYVSDMTNPTNVEFQYYRSVNKHTDSQQGNQVYVYKLTNANKWTVTVRNTFSKVIAGDNLTSSFVESETNSSITLAADYDTTVTQSSTKLITSGAVYDAIANQQISDLDDLSDVNISSPSNGDVLKYDSTNSEWVNSQASNVSSLDDLSDVTILTPSDGDVLKYDSTSGEWINGQGGSSTSSLDDLTNVTITTPSDGQVLKYDSTSQEWVNGTGGGGSSDPHITLTQAQYDALVQAGTVDPTAFYFITDQEMPTIHYSTNERIIGTWVDGSTLYEKTIEWSGKCITNSYAVIDSSLRRSGLAHFAVISMEIRSNSLPNNIYSHSLGGRNIEAGINTDNGIFIENYTTFEINYAAVTVQYTKISS